jgi:hypothetical protein
MCDGVRIHNRLQTQRSIGKICSLYKILGRPYFIPLRKAGAERITSPSCGTYLSGTEQFQQEMPLPPCYEEWMNAWTEDEQQIFARH